MESKRFYFVAHVTFKISGFVIFLAGLIVQVTPKFMLRFIIVNSSWSHGTG